jgi:hypothetical protein
MRSDAYIENFIIKQDLGLFYSINDTDKETYLRFPPQSQSNLLNAI